MYVTMMVMCVTKTTTLKTGAESIRIMKSVSSFTRDWSLHWHWNNWLFVKFLCWFLLTILAKLAMLLSWNVGNNQYHRAFFKIIFWVVWEFSRNILDIDKTGPSHILLFLTWPQLASILTLEPVCFMLFRFFFS